MVDNVAFTIFGFDIYWYGILITLGAVLGVVIGVKRARKEGYNPEFIYDFLFWVLPLSIIGARLYYVIFEWSYYSQNLSRLFAIRDGGLAIYGGVIGGAIAVFLFDKFYKKPKPTILGAMDIYAPSLVLGQAIGRWGNFFNQEAYSFIEAPEWMRFPLAVYIENIDQWRLATFFYESFWNICVFFFLIWYRNRPVCKKGDVTFLYLMLYSLGRMFIEGLRADSLWLIPGYVRVSQLLALVLVVFGAVALYLNHRKGKQTDGLY